MKRTFVQRILIAAIGTISFLVPSLKAQEEGITLTIQTRDCSVIRSPNKSNYAIGETVVLTAKPMTGFCFVEWSGSISGTTNPITIVMNENKMITATCKSTTVTEENSITEGLVFHALFDDLMGLTAEDANNIENAVLLVNGPKLGDTWREDDLMSLSAPYQAIAIPTVRMNVKAGTIAVWLEPKDLSGTKFIIGHVCNNMNRLCLYMVGGKLAVGMGSTAKLKEDIANITTEKPIHLALTWKNTDYAVYVDGQKKAEGKFSGLTELNKTIDIGNYGDPAFRSLGFIGRIDDIRIYSRALNPEEIKDLFFTHDIRQGKELRFTVQAIDTEGAPVLYEASSLPKGASFDKTTQTATWTPWHDQKGVFKFEFTSPNQPKRVVHVVVHPTKMAEWYEKAREVMSTYEK
jgi:hypothetical protein